MSPEYVSMTNFSVFLHKTDSLLVIVVPIIIELITNNFNN